LNGKIRDTFRSREIKEREKNKQKKPMEIVFWTEILGVAQIQGFQEPVWRGS
jgi:hypothetical protein